MELLFSISLHNAAVMALLAILVWGATRLWKSAPAAHFLWLIVLVKLITPPVVYFDAGRWADFPAHPAVPAEVSSSIDLQRSINPLRDRTPQPESNLPTGAELGPSLEPVRHPASTGIVQRPAAESSPPQWAIPSWRTIRLALAWTWLLVAAQISCVAGIRIIRFRRMLSSLLPASPELQSTADDLALRMGRKRSAEVLQVESATAPFVWCFGSRPAIVLPRRLIDTLDPRQLEMVLAHELAHLCRRDHWIRVAELAVSILYWWNPLAWWVRRQLHAAEEECCDAWVATYFPDQNHLYAESLLKSAEALGSPSVLLSSPFLNPHTLKERVELVLRNRSQRKATPLAVACLGLLAVAMLPTGVSIVHGAGERPSTLVEEQRGVAPPGEAASHARETGQKRSDAPSGRHEDRARTAKTLSQELNSGAEVASPPETSRAREGQTPVNPPRPAPSAEEEVASLQGTWCWDFSQPWTWPQPIGVGTDSDGRKSEKRWVIEGSQITWVGRDGQRVYVTFTIDPTTTPRQIEFTFLNGPHRGKKSIGIYESRDNDDYWTLCMTDPGTDAPRPTDFSAGSFLKQSIIAIYRVPPPAKPSAANELKRLQGVWQMQLCDSIHRTFGGTQQEASKWQWTIQDDEILWSRQGEVWKIKLHIGPSKKPRGMDLTFHTGPFEMDLTFLSGPFTDAKCAGIYGWGGIDGQSLLIAIQDPGSNAPRPTEFRMRGDVETGLMILRPSSPSDAEREIAAFQGPWTLRNFDTGRSDRNKDPSSWPIPGGNGPDRSGEGSELRWVMKQHEITWTSPSGQEIRASFTLDSFQTPKQIDLTFLSGPHQGETCAGIYQRDDLDENILWLCMADPGSPKGRPKEFSYQWGEGRSLLSLYPFRPADNH